MPTYDYRCKKCGTKFELFHSITDDRPKKCPKCGARAARVPSGGAGLLFKGSGFYITDYRSDSYKEKAKSEKPASDSGGASKPADKPADKPAGGKPPDAPSKSKKKKGD